MHVLFVCTGNICRSPLAERLAVALAAESGIEGFSASSAGTRAVVGSAIEPTAACVLEGLGGRPDGFRARRLTPEIASAASIVLTMTEAHRDEVLNLAPGQLRSTFTLRAAARLTAASGARTIAEIFSAQPRYAATRSDDILDPIGRDEATFVAIGSEIAELLVPVLTALWH